MRFVHPRVFYSPVTQLRNSRSVLTPSDRSAVGLKARGLGSAPNESFSGWTKTFTDPRLCAAIVDRLTFGGNIIETSTDSYRLATTRARAEQQAAS